MNSSILEDKCYVKMMSSCCVASQCIQELLEAFFYIKMSYLMVNKKRIHYLFEDGIANSVPRNHRFSSLGKPADAKQ